MDEARSLTYSINVTADTSQAENNIRSVTGSIGTLQSQGARIGIEADASQAESNIRSVSGSISGLQSSASGVGSAFRSSFLEGIDGGNSFTSSLKSGVGGALSYVESKATEFKENIISGAENIVSSFSHPIETIKNGLGGAVESAQNRFVDMARSAEGASDAADDLGNSSSNAANDVRDLGDSADSSGGKMGGLKKVLLGIGAAVTAATVAVGGFAASSIETGAVFDSSMSQVAATMGYSTDELNDSTSEASQTFGKLRNYAMEMGSQTAFSASEAADALNYMALAGYDADTSMTMLPNVLNLAAAGGIELASASDMVTDAQSALGLSLDETSELVDKMAVASSKSNTSVEQLGNAILAIGGTAQNLAGGTTELSASLGILADNGIKGAEGGTHLRNIILSLASPTDTAAKQLEKLGVNVFDAEGKMRPLNETFGDLQSSMKNMSQGDQIAAIGKIFNTTDIASVNALLGTSAERWDELYGAIGDFNGAAQNMADVQLDNLEGDITLFKSALEGAQIVVSDQLTPTLREFVQFGSESVSELSTAFQEGGLSGAMGALGNILSDALSMVIDMLPTLIDAGMQLLGSLGQGILDNLPTLIDAAAQIIVTLASGIGNSLPTLVPSIVQTVVLMVGTLIDNLPLILDAGMQILSGLAQGIVDAVPVLIESLPELINQIVGFLSESLPMILEQGVQILTTLSEGIFEAVPLLLEQLPTIITSIADFFVNNMPVILEQGIQLVTNLAMGIINGIPELLNQLPTIITNITSTITEHLPQIIETGVNLLLQLASGIISAIPELVAQLPQIITAIVGCLGSLLGSIVDIGKSIVEGIWSGISAMGSWIKDKVTGFFGGIVDGVKGLLGIHSPSTVFAGIGDNMALGVGKGFEGTIGGVKKDIEKSMPTELDMPDIKGPKVDIPNPDIPSPNAPKPTAGGAAIVPDTSASAVYGSSEPVNYKVSPIIEDAKISPMSDMTYGVSPIVEGMAAPTVSDVTYSVNPVVSDVRTPDVADVTYDVNPVVGEFNPPDTSASAVYGSSEPVTNTESSKVQSDNMDSTTAFSPNIVININGNADEETVDNMRSSLRDTVRELFEEFRQEELENVSIKNQYAY